MASYVVIILPPWNRQKVIVLWYSRSLGDRIHSDYPFHAHLEGVSEHYNFFFTQINLCLGECMYITVEVISSLILIYIFPPAWEPMQYFFVILGTTLWDYINKKTGRGQRSLSISIYPDEQLPVNSRDGDCTICHQPGFQTTLFTCLLESATEYWRGCCFWLRPCSELAY